MTYIVIKLLYYTKVVMVNLSIYLNLLFISYKFVKGFLAIPFLLLVISSWNFHNVCQCFLYNQEQNFSWIRQNVRISPIDPHYKNRPLLYMTLQKWAIFIMGVYGENICLLSDQAENSFLVIKNTSCKFQFKKTCNRNVIAKKPLANLYEMNSRTELHASL